MDKSINTFNNGLETAMTNAIDYINNTLSLYIVFIIMACGLLYIIITMTLGSSSQSTTSTNTISNFNTSLNSTSFIPSFTSFMPSFTSIFVGILIIICILFGLLYFLGIDVISTIFSSNPTDVDNVDNIENATNKVINTIVPDLTVTPEVFNIPDNDFVYSDAKALCSAYGAKLATYTQVEDVYKSGGEWCNYGWSEGQMALFPTQQNTWNELQKKTGHENDCGRPGINGGYIANPKVKFGVNCYGFKPKMTSTEEMLMVTKPNYPKTTADLELENRVNYWKDKLTQILVSPFNHTSWSKI